MAYDAQLILRDSAAANSGSLAVVSTALTGTFTTPVLVLPGTPLRGLDLNIVAVGANSLPAVQVILQEAVSSGATFNTFRQWPTNITAAGEYNMRFHLDHDVVGNKLYPAIRALLSVTCTSSGGGFTTFNVKVGMDAGAYGNGAG